MEESGELDSSQNETLKPRKISKTLAGKKKIRYFNSSKSIDRTLHRSKERIRSTCVISAQRAKNRALVKLVEQERKEKQSLNLRICQLEQELNRFYFYAAIDRFEKILILNKERGVGYLEDAANMCSSANSESSGDPAPDISSNSIKPSYNTKAGSGKVSPSSSPKSNSTSENPISSDGPDVGAAKEAIYDFSLVEESPAAHVSLHRSSCAKKSFLRQRSESFLAAEMTSHPEEPNNQLVIPGGATHKSGSVYSERCSTRSSNEIQETAPIPENTGIERIRETIKAELEKNKLPRGTFVFLVLNSKQIAPCPPEKTVDSEDYRPTFSTRAENSLSPKFVEPEPSAYPCQDFLSQRYCRSKSSKGSRQTSLECGGNHPSPALHITIDEETTAQCCVSSTQVIEEEVGENSINNNTTNTPRVHILVEETARSSGEMQPAVMIDRCLVRNSKKKSDALGVLKQIQEATRLSIELQPTVVIERCRSENNKKKSDSEDDKETQTKRRREDETDQVPVTNTSLSPNNDEQVTRRGRFKNVVNYKLPLLSTKLRNESEECFRSQKKKYPKKKSLKH